MPRIAVARRLAPLALVAALTAMVATDSSGPAGASPSPATDAACEQPDCFAALAFNPATGAWGATKNYPARKDAKAEAMRLCRSFDRKDRQCEALGTVRGERCIGAAMQVKQRTIRAHAVAKAPSRRKAWTGAVADLDGKQQFRHRITAICNG